MAKDNSVISLLRKELGDDKIYTDRRLKDMTTMKVGGPAAVVATPYGHQETIRTIRLLKEQEIPFVLLGRGSNVLACDEGYRGVVVRLCENFQNVTVEGDLVSVQAGSTVASVARLAAAKGLAGCEFLAGIPGTMGGGLYMNAGAYGSELKDIVESVDIMDRTGSVYTVDGRDMGFGYRQSLLQTKSWFALGCRLRLTPEDPEVIKEKIRDLNKRRKEKQPLEWPSAGSTFKRPKDNFAGGLIEQAGLKGLAVGGAMVSEKHAGFVINTGEATCKDVIDLIHLVQEKVEKASGIHLEPEVRYLNVHGWDVLK